MMLPALTPLKPRYHDGAFGVDAVLSRRQESNAQEMARLQRLQDLRGLMHPSRQASTPPGRGSGASTPNLHDFGTKTHLARLDLAIESLGLQLEQCQQNVSTALSDQNKGVEEYIGKALKEAASEKKSSSVEADVLGPVLTRLGSLEDRLSTTSPEDSKLHVRLTALEKKITSSPVSSDSNVRALEEMQPWKVKLSMLEDRVNSLSSPASPSGASRKDLDLHARVAAVENRLTMPLPIESEVHAQLNAFAEKLSVAAVGQAELRAQLDNIEHRVTSSPLRKQSSGRLPLQDHLAAFSAKVDGLQSSFDNLEDKVTVNASAIAASGAPATPDANLKAAVAQVTAQFEDDLARLNPALQSHAKGREALSKDLEAIQKQVCAAAPQLVSVKSLKAAIDGMKTQMLEIQDRISSVSTASDASCSKLDLAVKDLADQCRRLEDRSINQSLLPALTAGDRSFEDSSSREVGDDRILAIGSSVAGMLEKLKRIEDAHSKSDEIQAKLDVAVSDLAQQFQQLETKNTYSHDRSAPRQEEQGRRHGQPLDESAEAKLVELDEKVKHSVDTSSFSKVMADMEERIGEVQGRLLKLGAGPTRSEHEELLQRIKSAEKKLHLDELVQGLQTQIKALQNDELNDETLLRPTPPTTLQGDAVPHEDSSASALRRSATASKLDAASPSQVAVLSVSPTLTTKQLAQELAAPPPQSPPPTAPSTASSPPSAPPSARNDGAAAKPQLPPAAMPSNRPDVIQAVQQGGSSSSTDPRGLQLTEKRAAAAAVVLMEKRLQGFVQVQDFARLREHVEAGFDSIGNQIKAASDAQIANYGATLERFLHKRRVKGWLKTYPAKYGRMVMSNDIKLLQATFHAWSKSRGLQEDGQPSNASMG